MKLRKIINTDIIQRKGIYFFLKKFSSLINNYK